MSELTRDTRSERATDETNVEASAGASRQGDHLFRSAEGKTAVSAARAGTALSLGPDSRLTQPVREAAIKAVSAGMRRHAALVLAGIPTATAGRWLAIANGTLTQWPDRSPIAQDTVAFLRALSEDFARAEAECEARAIQNIARAAQTTNEKTGIPEWRAGAWLMEHAPAYKRDYAEYREQRIEHAGSIDHTLRAVQQLPDADLIEALPEDWRELVPELPAPRDP